MTFSTTHNSPFVGRFTTLCVNPFDSVITRIFGAADADTAIETARTKQRTTRLIISFCRWFTDALNTSRIHAHRGTMVKHTGSVPLCARYLSHEQIPSHWLARSKKSKSCNAS